MYQVGWLPGAYRLRLAGEGLAGEGLAGEGPGWCGGAGGSEPGGGGTSGGGSGAAQGEALQRLEMQGEVLQRLEMARGGGGLGRLATRCGAGGSSGRE